MDQNFDTYTTEFTFPDGTKLYMEGRTIAGCHQEFASYCHGTKGSGRISTGGHWPSQCRLFKTQKMDDKDTLWDCGEEHESPYQTEWEDLMKAIREDKPYNEVERGAKASLRPPWAGWRPTPGRSSPTTRCSTASTSSPRAWTS